MSKQLDADAIIDQLHGLASKIQGDTIRDILIELRTARQEGPLATDADTWIAGFQAAIETIDANYISSPSE